MLFGVVEMGDDCTLERTQAAQTLMHRLFAPASVAVPGVEHAVMYRFGEHVGGDVADVFDCGSDGVFISLADIQGSGEQAATHAAMVKYGIRAYACAHRRPAQVLENLNDLYIRDCTCEGTESFATLFLGLVERDRRKMTYVSAGYEAAMLLYPNGFSQVLPASGPIVGVLGGGQARFEERTVDLSPNAVLIAVSDGVTDARCGRRRFGLSRVRHLLSERADAALNVIVRDVMDAASAFCHGNITDDMAILAVRLGGEA